MAVAAGSPAGWFFFLLVFGGAPRPWGGFGVITGAVTVGNGVTAGAVLLPGTAGTPGNLTINNNLTFNPLSTYECVLDRTIPTVGKVTALGVIIQSGATFEFVDRTAGTLTPARGFTADHNNSAEPISR